MSDARTPRGLIDTANEILAQHPDPYNQILGLAEDAAYNARHHLEKGDVDTARDWGKAALATYDLLLLKKQPPRAGDRLSEMYLRALFIDQLGPRHGDDLRDPGVFERWFFENLNGFTPRTAREASALFPNLSPSDVAKLRAIKNMLGVAEILVPKGSLRHQHELEEWLSVRERLV